MRFEIRKSGGPVCGECGATELVRTSRTEADLRRDLHQALPAPPSRLRPFRRRHVLHVHRLFDEAIEQLKTLTLEA